jgi:hypothetical protein
MRPDPDISKNSFGIGRMSDEEYDSEFSKEGVTPRPGTSNTGNAAAARAASRAIRSFSQLAVITAAENKRRKIERTDYWVAENIVIKRALIEMEKRLCQQRSMATSSPDSVMSEADFDILKHTIEGFSVHIVVHDSITLSQLKQMRVKCLADLSIHTATMTKTPPATDATEAAAFIQKCQEHYKNDLTHLNVSLSAEINRMQTVNETVPSQHAQIAHSSGPALQNILSPETIRRRFLSLNALTRAIRSDLLAFLANDARGKDHAIVVQQIKDSRAVAATEKKL